MHEKCTFSPAEQIRARRGEKYVLAGVVCIRGQSWAGLTSDSASGSPPLYISPTLDVHPLCVFPDFSFSSILSPVLKMTGGQQCQSSSSTDRSEETPTLARELMAVSTRTLQELASCKEELSACKQELPAAKRKKPASQPENFRKKAAKCTLSVTTPFRERWRNQLRELTMKKRENPLQKGQTSSRIGRFSSH